MLGTMAATSGCGWIIGLDEFTDAPPGGGGRGGGCTSPAECPGGEHGTAACEGGACGLLCDDGFADCDADVSGCESSTTTDKANCGGCGVTCSAYCVDGSCNDPVYIAVGYGRACAILKDGSLWCWGAVPGPVIIDGIQTQPTRVELAGPATQVAIGGGSGLVAHHTCAVLADQTVQCWGGNNNGQLGLGHTSFTPTPTDVGLTNIQQISLGWYHTCAVEVGGRLLCWGYNDNGNVGDGTTTTALSPVEVATSIAQVSAGGTHTCAMTIDGHFRCWGLNSSGELGDGSQVTALLPTPVAGLFNGVEIVSGGYHTCARTRVGAFCWGANYNGQLGLGSEMDQHAPQPLTLAGINAIAAGRGYSGALVDGSVYTWGNNLSGQLGNGTAAGALSPTEIGLGQIKRLSIYWGSSCALTEAGAVFCWGSNANGELGDGSTIAKSVPTAVLWP